MLRQHHPRLDAPFVRENNAPAGTGGIATRPEGREFGGPTDEDIEEYKGILAGPCHLGLADQTHPGFDTNGDVVADSTRQVIGLRRRVLMSGCCRAEPTIVALLISAS